MMYRSMMLFACILLMLSGNIITGCGGEKNNADTDEDITKSDDDGTEDIDSSNDDIDSVVDGDSEKESEADSGNTKKTDGDGELFEAENFVAAGEMNRDFDEQDDSCTNENSPGTDILETSDNGCVIGYTQPGEWFEYLIDVPEAATFDIIFSVGSGVGAVLSVAVDGQERSTVSVEETDWESFGEVTLTGLQLSKGEHTLRITVENGAINFDWFRLTQVGDCVSSCGERNCGQDECGNECGTCNDEDFCSDEQICLDDAACAATCGDNSCGFNVCGGSCGTCSDDETCTPTGHCWRTPDSTPVERHGQISVSGNKLLDENGDILQLKGVSTQWLNWEKKYSTSAAALEWMRDNWALELLRVANGVENNSGYLIDPEGRMAMVKQIIDNAIENGVYVIVDWHTHEGLDHIDEAKAFFKEIAQAYGEHPNIIYEIFNEPLKLDWSEELKPYHEEVISVIREHDGNNLIVVGTPNWDQTPDVAIGDPIDDPAVAYALHFYACTHTASIRDNGQDALDANLPVFITEWGATNADGGTAKNPGVCEDSAREWHAWMEENNISWAAWKMSSDGDDSAFLKSSASVDGGWTEDDINGHGYLIHEFLMDEQ